MENVLPILFLDDDGGPLEFSIRGLSPETSIIVSLIKKGGGIVHMKRDGPNTILLDKPGSRIFGEEEYFSCSYIADCCESNCLLDINKYRLNKNSKYVQDYDANLILLKKKSWKDIPLHRDEDLDDVEVEEEDEIYFHCSNKTKRLNNIARPYRECERIAIINWIIKNKSYSSVGGNALWMQMEEEKVCEGRTWQSLKEHFKKKILPNIDKYNLPKNHVKCFKTRRSHYM